MLGFAVLHRFLTPTRDSTFTEWRPVAQKETSDSSNDIVNWNENEEIKTFREYLRIPTVHPNVDYGNDMK